MRTNKKKYDAWKKENDKRDPRVTRNLTAEELAEAKRDKEVIQRVTKKINNRAEEYSENMETAAATILGSSLLLGGAISFVVDWVLNKFGANNKLTTWLVHLLAGKEVREAYNNLSKQKPDTKEYKEAWQKLQEVKLKQFDPFEYYSIKERQELSSLSSKLRETVDSEERKTISAQIYKIMDKYSKEKANCRNALSKKSKASKFIDNFKRDLTTFLENKWMRTKMIGILGTGISSMIGIIMALKLQKNAARAGRYNAKEELRNNPQEFISYSEDEMKQVENVKAKEKTMGQKFKEYITFVPTAWKHYKEYDNYKKGELKDTKALKEELKKLEVSEEQLREGKNLQRKLFNTFEKIDDKSQEYSENMEAASEISMELLQFGGLIALIAPFVTFIGLIASKRYDILAKMGVNVADFLTRFTGFAKSKFVKNNLDEMANRFEEAVKKQVIDINQKTCDEAFESIEQKIKMNMTPDAEDFAPFLKEGLSFVNNNKIIKWVSNLPFVGKLFPFLVKSAQGVSRISLEKLVSGLEKSDLNKFKPLMDKLAKLEIENINTFFAKLKESTVEQLMDKAYLTKIINESKLPLDEADIDSISKLLGRIKDADGSIDKLKAFLVNAEKNPKLKEILNDSGKMPEIVSEAVKSGAEIVDNISDIKLSALIDSYIIKNIPEDASSLEKYLEFAKKIGSATTSATKNKKYYIRGARALARLSQNVPAAEIASAMQKILKVAIENPEKAASLLSNPRAMNKVLMTPSLNRALKAAGISWGVFCIGITFAIQSYFAKLQKEAGRLGVMKAMEELQDDRIYADKEPKKSTVQTTSLLPQHQNNSNTNTSNLPSNIQKLLNANKNNQVAV